MAVNAGQAIVRISADNSGLTRGLRDAQAKLNAFSRTMAQAGGTYAAVGGAALAPFVASLRSFGRYGDELNKLSDRTGDGVQSLAALRWAAEQADVPFATLTGALARLRNNLGSGAIRGGLADALKGKDAQTQLMMIADSLNAIEDDAKRTAIVMDLFGRSGFQLLPLLRSGSKGMRAMAAEARRIGLIITPEQAANATAFVDALNKVWAAVRGVSVALGASLARDAATFADGLGEAIGGVSAFIAAHKDLVKVVAVAAIGLTSAGTAFLAFAGAAKSVAFVLGGLSIAAKAVGAIVAAFSGITAAVVASPFFIGAVAVAGFATALYECSAAVRQFVADAGSKSTSAIGRAWGALADYIGGIWRQVSDYARERIKLIWNALKANNVEDAFAVICNSAKKAFADIGISAMNMIIDVRYAFAEYLITTAIKIKNAYIAAFDAVKIVAIDIARSVVSAFDRVGVAIAKNLVSGVRAAMNFVMGEGAFEKQFGALETFMGLVQQYTTGATPELDKAFNAVAEAQAKHQSEAAKELKYAAAGVNAAREEAKQQSGILSWLAQSREEAAKAMEALKEKYGKPQTGGEEEAPFAPLSLENMDNATKGPREIMRGVGTVGSAAALRALEGKGFNIDEAQLKAQQETAKATKKTADEVRKTREAVEDASGAIDLQ